MIVADRDRADPLADVAPRASAWRAACVDEQADQHEPQAVADVDVRATEHDAADRSRHAEQLARRAQARVARLASPVSLHAIARAMRPPSSGSAGSRLNTSSTALISASQREQHERDAGVQAGLEQRDVEEVVEAAERRVRRAMQSAMTSGVDERAGRGERELGARRARLAAGAREAAERPQVDPVDRHALAARDERVPELVRDDRGEEQQRPDGGGDERLRCCSARIPAK